MEGVKGVYVHILCGYGLSSTIIRVKKYIFLVLNPQIHKLAAVKEPKNYFRLSDLHKILNPGILDHFKPKKINKPISPPKTPKITKNTKNQQRSLIFVKLIRILT